MILGDVEETVTTIETDEETYEEIVRVRVLQCDGVKASRARLLPSALVL